MDPQSFADALRNPDFLAKAQKSTEIAEFKAKFNVIRATPLKCPSCSQWGQIGGSLWLMDTNPRTFVCRKCHLIWTIECRTISTDELIIEMKRKEKDSQ